MGLVARLRPEHHEAGLAGPRLSGRAPPDLEVVLGDVAGSDRHEEPAAVVLVRRGTRPRRTPPRGLAAGHPRSRPSPPTAGGSRRRRRRRSPGPGPRPVPTRRRPSRRGHSTVRRRSRQTQLVDPRLRVRTGRARGDRLSSSAGRIPVSTPRRGPGAMRSTAKRSANTIGGSVSAGSWQIVTVVGAAAAFFASPGFATCSQRPGRRSPQCRARRARADRTAPSRDTEDTTRHGRDFLAMFVAPRCWVEPAAHASILAPACDTYGGELRASRSCQMVIDRFSRRFRPRRDGTARRASC